MKTGCIPAIVTLFAAMLTCVICLIRENDTIYSLILISIVMVVFFVIGNIAKKIIEFVLSKEVDENFIEMTKIESETLGDDGSPDKKEIQEELTDS